MMPYKASFRGAEAPITDLNSLKNALGIISEKCTQNALTQTVYPPPYFMLNKRKGFLNQKQYFFYLPKTKLGILLHKSQALSVCLSVCLSLLKIYRRFSILSHSSLRLGSQMSRLLTSDEWSVDLFEWIESQHNKFFIERFIKTFSQIFYFTPKLMLWD